MMKIGFKSMNDLDVISGLFGSVSATPAFIKILGSAVDDFSQVLSGDKALFTALHENFRMLE